MDLMVVWTPHRRFLPWRQQNSRTPLGVPGVFVHVQLSTYEPQSKPG